jgi:hypothetical protein
MYSNQIRFHYSINSAFQSLDLKSRGMFFSQGKESPIDLDSRGGIIFLKETRMGKNKVNFWGSVSVITP